jgi:hypothetical protein
MSDISEFAQGVWIVEGPNVRDMGIMFTTRMTVVKLSDGSCKVCKFAAMRSSPKSAKLARSTRYAQILSARFNIRARRTAQPAMGHRGVAKNSVFDVHRCRRNDVAKADV